MAPVVLSQQQFFSANTDAFLKPGAECYVRTEAHYEVVHHISCDITMDLSVLLLYFKAFILFQNRTD